MFNDHALADCAGAILIEKAERRLDALLAEHGVSDPKELPPATAFEIFQRAVIETAAATFPAANVEMLKHNCRSFGHSAFLTAMERMRVSCKRPRGLRSSCRPLRPGRDAHPHDTQQRH